MMELPADWPTTCENSEAVLLSEQDGFATYRCTECGDIWEQLA